MLMHLTLLGELMKTKEELLADLKKMGIKPDKAIRKPRSDAGDTRGIYKPRNDKGKQRGTYNNTAAKYKAVYDKMLSSHAVSGSGDGADTLTRDRNDIFPPNLNRYYRQMRSKDREYISSVIKPAHLEQARWRWLMAEYAENPTQWGAHISKWYFIKESEIGNWMYTEWAWAYVNHIGGEENRLTDNPITLVYYDYVMGRYNGHPEFDKRGDIIWKK